MLTYLINVTADILALSLVVGVMFAFIDRTSTDKGKMICRICMVLGLIAAGIRAYITNTKRLKAGWKVGAYGYTTAICLFIITAVILVVFARWYFKRSGKTKLKAVSEILISAFTGLLTASYIYCALPNVLVYPFKFDTGGNGVLSTEYLFRLGGYLLGLMICIASAVSANKLCAVAGKKGYTKLMCAVFYCVNTIYAVYCFARLMLVLIPRKIFESDVLFSFAAASNNGSRFYTYILFFLLIIEAVFLIVKSYTSKEPYSTNAEHRKQKAVWRSAKRGSVVLCVCFILGILCSTLFVKLNTVVIREAPVEDPIIDNDVLFVPLEMVEDGHLHRFGYTTEEGSLVRFIVVLKQENTNNYGVGLDACEICGEAGYYENKDDQIVCKKCNVVMNKTTIGMKGGCNPIIIEYDIDENGITVPIEEMVKNQSRFKN